MKAPKLRLLHRIMKTTQMYRLLIGFLLYFLFTSLAIWLVDPAIESLGDSLWYCFVSCTTVGFGDLVTVSLLGKILTVVLTLYGILIVAFIPGVIVSYFTEFNRLKAKESVVKFLDQLEKLDQLTPEELREISQRVRQRRYKL